MAAYSKGRLDARGSSGSIQTSAHQARDGRPAQRKPSPSGSGDAKRRRTRGHLSASASSSSQVAGFLGGDDADGMGWGATARGHRGSQCSSEASDTAPGLAETALGSSCCVRATRCGAVRGCKKTGAGETTSRGGEGGPQFAGDQDQRVGVMQLSAVAVIGALPLSRKTACSGARACCGSSRFIARSAPSGAMRILNCCRETPKALTVHRERRN